MNNPSPEARLEALEASLNSAKRKLAATWALAALGTTAAFTLGFYKNALAQGYGVTLAQLATRMTALETKTRYFTVTGTPSAGGTLSITRANLVVRSGLGDAQGEDYNQTNGRGNVIIGYNEIDGQNGDERSGSHNLVIGAFNDYSAYGGLVVGSRNRVAGRSTSVVGGSNNTADSEVGSSVTGGIHNTASINFSTVSGGYNRATGHFHAWAGGHYYEDER